MFCVMCRRGITKTFFPRPSPTHFLFSTNRSSLSVVKNSNKDSSSLSSDQIWTILEQSVLSSSPSPSSLFEPLSSSLPASLLFPPASSSSSPASSSPASSSPASSSPASSSPASSSPASSSPASSSPASSLPSSSSASPHSSHILVTSVLALSHVSRGEVDYVRLSPFLTKIYEQLSDMPSYLVSRVFESITNISIEKTFWRALCMRAREVGMSFSTTDIAHILFVLAKKIDTHNLSLQEKEEMKQLEIPLISLLCVQGIAKASFFTAEQISYILHALSKLGKQKNLVKRFCKEINLRIHEFDVKCISRILNSFVKLNIKSTNDADEEEEGKKAMANLCLEMSKKISLLQPKDIALTLNSLVRLKIYDKILFEKLCEQVLEKGEGFDAHSISSTLNALVRFSFYNKQVLQKLLSEIIKKIGDFDPQGIANTLNALAKFSEAEKQSSSSSSSSSSSGNNTEHSDNNNNNNINKIAIKKLCQAANQRASFFNSQQIATTFNALAKLNVYDEMLLIKKLCQEILVHSTDFSSLDAQALALTLNSFTKFRFSEEKVVKRLCIDVLAKISTFAPEYIALTLNALAKFGVCDEILIKRLCEEATKKVKKFHAKEIAMIMNALAKLDSFYPPLFDGFCEEIINNNNNNIDDRNNKSFSSSSFEPQTIANILNALARFCLYNGQVISKLCDEAIKTAEKFEPQAIANTLNALAKFGINNEVLIKKLSQYTLLKINKFNLTDMAMTLHGLIVLGHYDFTLYELVRVALEKLPDISKLQQNLGILVAQCRLAVNLEQPTWPALPRLAGPLQPTHFSEFHQQVSNALSELGVLHTNECLVAGLMVDIVLTDGRVMEVDGPCHFCRNSPRPLGTTLWKNRLLGQVRGKVMSVPYFVWYGLSESERLKYLSKLMAS